MSSSPFSGPMGRAPLLATLLSVGVTAWSSSAEAFCRTTTCIPGEDCEYDPQTGCAVTGKPLEWNRPCLSFGVQKDGSPLRGISYEEAHGIIAGAFSRWLGSNCDGKLPSIDLADLGAVACGQPQYNKTGPNANVWMFRDEGWEGGSSNASASETPSSTLAITIITFQPDTGEIFDADVEINSEQALLTTSDSQVVFDLASIVTHEAGHFLGLSHTREPGATMRAGYLPGTVSLRALSEDDELGMCAIYPPDRQLPPGNCMPRHGFSSQCSGEPDSGCSFGVPAPSKSLWPFGVGLVVAWGAWRRRRYSAG